MNKNRHASLGRLSMPQMHVVRMKLLEASAAKGTVRVPIGTMHDSVFRFPVSV